MKEYLEYRKAWESYPKEHYVSRFPINLDLELTSRCNLSCKMCPYHSKDAPFPREPEDMDFELYKKIIDEGSVKGLKAIKFGFGGEPLLYRQLPEAISYAKGSGILDVQINTNITLLTRHLAIKLLKSGLDLLILSDYDLDIQKQNAVMLQTLKQLLGVYKPTLRIQTFNTTNWEDIGDEYSTPKFYDFRELKEDFSKNDFECEYPWQRFLVLSDGTVMDCSCGTILVDKILGNAWTFDLESLWRGKKMTFLRGCHEGHNSHLVRECRLCHMRNEFKKGGMVK